MTILKKTTALSLLILMLIISSACHRNIAAPAVEKMKKPNQAFLKYGDTNETIVELNKVNNSVWVHTSYYEEKGVLVPSNGLVVVTKKGLVLVDTTKTERQMESLNKLVQDAFNSGFQSAIITQARPDRLGGASYLIKKKIPVSSLDIVAMTAEKKGFIVPDEIVAGDSAILNIDGTDFELYYPGEGHSIDNTLVWLKKDKLLYGSCIVVEYGAGSLGDTTDANFKKWPDSIKAIQERYPEIDIVIPGHGQWGDSSLLDYTVELLEE